MTIPRNEYHHITPKNAARKDPCIIKKSMYNVSLVIVKRQQNPYRYLIKIVLTPRTEYPTPPTELKKLFPPQKTELNFLLYPFPTP